MVTQSDVEQLDINNTKALVVATGLLKSIEHDHKNVDYASLLQVICDYLKSNDNLFAKVI